VSISIRAEDGTEVDVDEVGRVWIKTPACTLGYWENPEATAEVLEDGWLDSGDLVRRDDDGYLWFFGRKKQIIVHDGSNISPLEVEGALLEHPDVGMAGVVGIHDLMHGENVRAYVTVKDEHPTPTSQELIDFARARVGYKAPEEVVVLDEIPLNPTGKIDRPRSCASPRTTSTRTPRVRHPDRPHAAARRSNLRCASLAAIPRKRGHRFSGVDGPGEREAGMRASPDAR
jgi:acyl-CoA synthetase (AMP-forming)/AMP-acid ligase II